MADTVDVPLCSMQAIVKRFGGIIAVDHVDFTLFSGEVHALTGENGAGKSTLMKVLDGLYPPDEGRIELLGRPVAFASVRTAEAAGIAMVPQELDLFPELSVAENLFVGRRRPRTIWGGIDWAALRREAETVFRELRFPIDVSLPAKHLSTATAQMVVVARALLRQAKVVILDEPTATLSECEAANLFRVIADLTARGVGVVYISHRLSEVFAISDRITVMRDGKLISTGQTSTFTPEELVRLMVGRPLSQFFTRLPSAPGEVLLEVIGLCRTDAFQDIHLVLRSGEIVGLAGLVGAGRTDLAQALFGIHPAEIGEIRIHGEPVQIHSPAAALAHAMVYVPEERRSQGLFLPFSITRNITFSSLKRLSHRGFLQRRALQSLAERQASALDIRGAPLTSPAVRLSGGNQQKVVLAKALACEPAILLLDEPTRGIDVGAKSEIYRLIDTLAHQGKAILLISSEMDEVLSMSDRVLVMRQGRIVAEFDREHASAERIASAATGVTVPQAGLVGESVP
jgi:ABC-type sugar transport system ATPase subunit